MPPATPLPSIHVETTVAETHAREAGRYKRAVSFRPHREIDSDETWMFTDGSGSGWHGLATLRPGRDPYLRAREIRMGMANVGAEMNGLLMALEAAEPGERVAVVSDYLWSVYYILGWRKVHHPALKAQVGTALELLNARGLASLRFIHIRGHRHDGTSFGFWNHVADRLCAWQHLVDHSVPRQAFEGLASRELTLTHILDTA